MLWLHFAMNIGRSYRLSLPLYRLVTNTALPHKFALAPKLPLISTSWWSAVLYSRLRHLGADYDDLPANAIWTVVLMALIGHNGRDGHLKRNDFRFDRFDLPRNALGIQFHDFKIIVACHALAIAPNRSVASQYAHIYRASFGSVKFSPTTTALSPICSI